MPGSPVVPVVPADPVAPVPLAVRSGLVARGRPETRLLLAAPAGPSGSPVCLPRPLGPAVRSGSPPAVLASVRLAGLVAGPGRAAAPCSGPAPDLASQILRGTGPPRSSGCSLSRRGARPSGGPTCSWKPWRGRTLDLDGRHLAERKECQHSRREGVDRSGWVRLKR